MFLDLILNRDHELRLEKTDLTTVLVFSVFVFFSLFHICILIVHCKKALAQVLWSHIQANARGPKYAISKSVLIVFGMCLLGQKQLNTRPKKHFQKHFACVVAFSSAPWPKYAIKNALIVFWLYILAQQGLNTQPGRHFQPIVVCVCVVAFLPTLWPKYAINWNIFEHFLAALVSDFFRFTNLMVLEYWHRHIAAKETNKKANSPCTSESWRKKWSWPWQVASA